MPEDIEIFPSCSTQFVDDDEIRVYGFEGVWLVLLAIKKGDAVRQIVQSQCGEKIMVTEYYNRMHLCAAGPVRWLDAETSAAEIIFNKGSAVDTLKAASAGFLVMTDLLRTQNKITFTQNQTDKGF